MRSERNIDASSHLNKRASFAGELSFMPFRISRFHIIQTLPWPLDFVSVNTFQCARTIARRAHAKVILHLSGQYATAAMPVTGHTCGGTLCKPRNHAKTTLGRSLELLSPDAG